MRCFVHTREETVGHIHVGDIPGSGLCSFDDTQLPKLEIISCICWTCCRCANALWPRVIIFTNKSLIWNTLSVISDWPGIELAGAYVIGYDLLHVPWNVMGHLPGHDLFFFLLSMWERADKRQNHNVCSIQICQPLWRQQWCACVLQGTLSPSGREHESALTSLDSSIMRQMWHF